MNQIVSQYNLKFFLLFQSDEEAAMRESVSDNLHLKKFKMNLKKIEE